MRTLVYFLAASACAAFAQAAPQDTQPLQALLNEVHQLRVDLQTTAVTMQRVQIVLYRLQSQTALTTRATSQLDEARAKFGNAEAQRKSFPAQVQQMEDTLRGTQDPTERKRLEQRLPQMKYMLEGITNEEQRFQAILIDAETHHRAEQAKLTDLESQLDHLDKVLEGITRK